MFGNRFHLSCIRFVHDVRFEEERRCAEWWKLLMSHAMKLWERVVQTRMTAEASSVFVSSSMV